VGYRPATELAAKRGDLECGWLDQFSETTAGILVAPLQRQDFGKLSGWADCSVPSPRDP
jgi:hypothetical protein